MEITAIIGAITGGLAEVGKMVTTVFGFLGKGKVDQTEAMRQYYILQLKLKDLESYANQLQLSLTEKLMVGATWIKPLVLTTGFAIIAVCIFNIVCRTFGWGFEVNIFSWELAILLGLFIFVASGSAKVLIAVADQMLEWLSKRKNKQETKRGVEK